VEATSTLSVQQRLLKLANTTIDIAIIGGGIAGVGVARDAALRGYSVALFERGDFASGTSSRSSRLIHGGLRYLQYGRLGLVHESVSERWRLLNVAPHLVAPLPFIYPIYQGEKPRLGTIKTGTWLYSMLAAFRTPGPRRGYSAASLSKAEPHLRTADLVGGAAYYDCATNDARLTLETAIDAAACGAELFPRTTVTDVGKDGAGSALEVDESISGTRTTVRARVVVVAAGPWTDEVLGFARPETPGWLRPTKGTHIVLSHDKLKLNHAMVMKSVQGDHRVTFAIPWITHTYIGTTDTDCPNPDDGLTTTSEDIAYLLKITNHYFPEADLTPSDVVSTWAGVRPLIAPHDEVAKEDVDPSDISREERLLTYDDRFIVAAGGKLTTYRVMAHKITNKASKLLAKQGIVTRRGGATKTRPLPGAQGLGNCAALGNRLQANHPTLPQDWLFYLAQRYGVRGSVIAELAARDRSLAELVPGCAMVRLAEIHYHIAEEYATTIEDILLRRTYAHFRTADNGAAAAEAVADILNQKGVLASAQVAAAIADYRTRFTGSVG
jgi:glycerol-3-phosphate dehydrogenase